MEKDYAEALKRLVSQYYNHEISVADYKARRKQIIDLMDDEFNGSFSFSSDKTLPYTPENTSSY